MVSEPGTGSEPVTGAERLARLFHETYERLAPQFGYETRRESAKPWDEVPEQNRALMIAVCAEIMADPAGVAAGRTQAAADDVDLKTRLFDAESALAELVRLKDGPRDAAYERDKPIAWSRARAVLAQIPEGTDHDTH